MQQTPDFVIFLGRFHPLVVHLPIGFLLMAFVLEILSRRKKFEAFQGSVAFVLLIGAISAIVSVVFGLMLAQGGDYNENTLSLHKWMGIGVAVFSLLTWLIKTRPELLNGVLKKAYLPLFGLSSFLLLLGGHFGGSLTHGSDYLVQYAPPFVRTMAGLPAEREEEEIKPIENINEANVFADIIHPMVKARCQSCHNEDKMKGELRLDTREMWLEGGETGPAFVAGKADESEIYKRITLPEDHDDHMPPEGKRPLNEDQIEMIRWWINAGAPFDKTVAQLEIPENIQPILAKLGTGGDLSEKPTGVFALSVPPANEEALMKLQEEGVLVLNVAQEINFLQVQVKRDSSLFGNAQMQLLLPLAEQITWLDLRYASPDDYSVLAQLKNLSRLHLEQTSIKDEDLIHLSQLEQLEYLNLYGTNITNEGLKHLEKLSNLKSLYLWQTKVDKPAAEALMAKIPGLKIDMGLDLQTSVRTSVEHSSPARL
ncbi:MAG: c-type cytochrome domain-containing protein [Bacteroidia bacterium]|nr:c-type cytochrome domain-containing protein [Bacteroidia bacterium]